jgi:hypothetical protein
MQLFRYHFKVTSHSYFCKKVACPTLVHNLLTYRDLWAWLNAQFERPLATPALTQGTLFAA